MRIARLVTLAAVITVAGCSSNGTSPPPPPATVSAISAGGGCNCALLDSGAVRCWGANAYGELGNPAGLGDWSFVPVLAASVTAAAEVAAGGAHTCARLRSGAVWCWGLGAFGETGNADWQDSVTPVTVTSIASAIDVGAGFEHSCAVVGGAVSCWGRNNFGQLGNSTVATTGPNNWSAVPVTVRDVSGATAIAIGGLHSCALLDDASVKCWGGPFNGSPSGSPYHDPVAIASLENVIALAAGFLHACAVVEGGRVKCWALNDHGQLGDGTVDPSSAHSTDAVFVHGIHSATTVAAGIEHSCAVLAGGTVACWGNNDLGQLGDGTYTNSPTPVTVVGLTGATAVAAGGYHNCALVTGGQVRCWGFNLEGQLGLDPNLVHTSAVPVTVGF